MNKTKDDFQLTLQTLSPVVGLMVWSITSPLMPYISQGIKINPGQLSIILAMPVVLGSTLCVPFGYLTNIIDTKWVFFCSFIVLLLPIFFLGQAQSPGMLMASGLFLGVGGAIFFVDVTSVPKCFSRDKVGLVNGIYGMRNIGTAISSFLVPPIVGIVGWQTTIRSYLIVIAVFAILIFSLGDAKEPEVKAPLSAQVKDLSSNYKLYYLSLWYSIIFGAFVAFGLSLPNYLVNNFGIGEVDAGIRSGVFIASATFLGPVGGILGDKFNAVKVLMTDFVVMIIGAVISGVSSHITLFTIGCLTISICAGLGNGLIFKLVPSYFAKESGTANGIVSTVGGLGGLFPPLVITYVTSLTGSSYLAFILLAVFGILTFITMDHLYKGKYAK